MCLNCGCGKPDDDHGNDANITMDDLRKAGEANGQDVDQTVANIEKAYHSSPTRRARARATSTRSDPRPPSRTGPGGLDRPGPCHAPSGTGRFGTMAAMATPAPETVDPVPHGRGDPRPLPRVLRRARPHDRPERQPRAGGRPDAAVHELRHGPVQGRADAASRSATTRGPSTTSAACGSRASTTTSRRSAGRPRHHTLFEMLGNWSFGDYFKRDAIHWAWQFLTRDLGIPEDRLAATVYTTDDVAHAVWKDEIGLPPERLVRWGDFPAGDEKNWWRMADVGPCGPCSELHYDRGAHLSEGPECVPDHSEHCPRWLEVWNLVFMEFELHPDRSLTPLPAPGVDTGMGLERVASVVQGVDQQLRHGPVRPDPRPDARAPRPRPGRVRAGALQLPGHRRPQPRRDVPRRRRRPALQRGPRLRPAPDHAPRDPPRPPPRAPRAVPRRDREGRHRHDGRRVPAPRGAARRDPRRHRARGAPVQPHARGRRRAARGGAHPAHRRGAGRRAPGGGAARRRAGAARRRRVPAPRHVRLPDRPDGRARGRVRRAHRPRRVPGRARRAARAEPERDEGRAREDRRAARRSTTGCWAAPRRPSSWATRRLSAEGRVVAILRDGIEYETLEAVPEVELRAEAAARAELVLDRTPFYAESGGQVADTRPDPRRGRRGPVRRRRRPARRRHADRRADRPPRRAPRRASASGTSSAPRSTPSAAPTRCATTPARTCSTARCATSSATGRGRRARSCTRTTSGSTSRSTAR